MYKIASILAKYIFKKNLISIEDIDTYIYGFQYVIEILISTVCSIIIALIFNMELDCILFFIFFIPMRSYCGGLHMDTYPACLLFSCITLTLVLLIVKFITPPLLFSFLLYLLSLFILIAIGPIDHPNRIFDSTDQPILSKKMNRIFTLSFIVAILFWILNFPRYLFTEALVILLICATSIIGKMKYSDKN